METSNQTLAKKVLFIAIILLCIAPLAYKPIGDYVNAPTALVAGFLFTLLLGHPFPNLSGKATSLLLKASVVGLGFGMNVHSAIAAGKDGIGLTVASITTVLTLGYFIGKALKLPRKLSHLVSSGTAICGGSAIAAVAPAVEADEKEISVSLGVIFLLNSIALILFPIIGHTLGMTDHEFGLWSAIAIHDTSSVVGAASAYSPEALDVAVTVKLARALWIIPISILSTILFKSKNSKVSIPWFIGFFIVAMLLNSYIPQLTEYGISSWISALSKAFLVVTLFLIGASLSIAKIKSVGYKPLLLGVILWIIISILSLVTIMYIY